MARDWRRGIKAEVRVRTGSLELASPLVARLNEAFAPLEAKRTGWTERCVAWILRGDDHALLDELATAPGVHAALSPLGSGIMGEGGSTRQDLLAAADQGLDPRLLVRLGTLLAACVEPRGHWSSVARTGELVFVHELSAALPPWLELLVWEQSDLVGERPFRNRTETLLAALDEAGEDRDVLVRGALLVRERKPDARAAVILGLSGMSELLAAHAELVAAMLNAADKHTKHGYLALFEREHVSTEPWLDILVAWSLEGPEDTRERAARALGKHGARASDIVSKKLARGSATQRERAADVLGRIAHPSAAEALRHAAETDRSEAVRTKARVAADGLAGQPPSSVVGPLPPLLDPVPTAPLSDDARRAFEQLCDTLDERARAEPMPAALREHVFHLLSMPEPWPSDLGCKPGWLWRVHFSTFYLPEVCGALFDRDEITPLHVVRYVYLTNGILTKFHGVEGLELADTVILSSVLERYARRNGPCELRTVASALESCGIPASFLAQREIAQYPTAFDWEPERLWPFFAQHLSVYEGVFGVGQPVTHHPMPQEIIARALVTLSWLPELPERLRFPIWQLAIGSEKTHRAAAQHCYARAPDRDARLFAALSDAKSDTRAVAAAWLADLRLSEAHR